MALTMSIVEIIVAGTFVLVQVNDDLMLFTGDLSEYTNGGAVYLISRICDLMLLYRFLPS